MGSVHEDRREPDRRDARYFALVLGRRKGISDETTAARQELASAEALYELLAADGYPICGACGALHPVKNHHCAKKQRRARLEGNDKAQEAELPPAVEVTGLLSTALERFQRDIDGLARRRERLIGEGNTQRFVVERSLPGETRLRQKDHSKEEWHELCEEFGKDPARTGFLDILHEVAVPGGVSPDPPEPLTRLIAMYLLSELPLGPLLEALHPNPEDADRVLLEAHVEGKNRKGGHSPGLKGEARSVARLIRGGALGRGS